VRAGTFSTAEGWSRDVIEDIAREIIDRVHKTTAPLPPRRHGWSGLRARTRHKLDGSCLAKITDLRIVVSGSPGSGKTTLVKALAQKFELPILDEGWKNIQAFQSVFADLRRDKKSSQADRGRAFGNWVKSYLDWADERKRLYSAHNGFVADRWEADLLSNWLNVFSGSRYGRIDEKTVKLLEDMRIKARTFSFAIVLPPQKIVLEDRNEEGLRREQSFTFRVMRSLLTSALVRQCSGLPIVSVPSQPFLVEERVSLIESVIQKTPMLLNRSPRGDVGNRPGPSAASASGGA
jgi:AAA domain